MKIKFFTILSLLTILFISKQGNAQKIFLGSGNASWNDASKWHANSLPDTTDDVTIQNSNVAIINIAANTTIKSLFFHGSPYNTTINIDSGVTLTINGNITYPNAPDGYFIRINIGKGSLVCNDIIFTNGGFNASTILDISTGSLICNKIKFGDYIGGLQNRLQVINVGDGFIMTNNITMPQSGSQYDVKNRITIESGELTSNFLLMATCTACDTTNKIGVTGMGTINVETIIGGTSANNDGTIDLGANGARGFGADTAISIPAGTYTNVKFSGDGDKTLAGNITVDKLIWSGNGELDLNGNSISFAANGTLIYRDATDAYSYTTANEWPTSNPPSNVVVDLTGNSSPRVTMGNNKTISDNLNMIAGSLALSNNTLTLNGTISGSGTLSANGESSNLVIEGSGDFGTIYMNQDTPEVTNRLNNLTFNRASSGTLSLGDTMQVIGVVTATDGTLTTNGNLVLSATSPTVYGQMAGTSSGTVSGDVVVEKVLEDVVAGWRHISLPAQNTINNINGLQVQTTSNPKTNQHSIYYWDTTKNGSTDFSNGWTVGTDSEDQSNAYSVYNNNANTGVHEINSKISIMGALTQSDYTITLSNHADPLTVSGGSNAYGWNFIPNRFASNIDVSNLIGDNDFDPAYKAIHVWDRAANQYVGINQSSLINYNTPDSLSPVNNIAPWQGFWVKADTTSQSIQVKKTHQTTDMTNANQFMKAGPDFMRLNVQDNKGFMDQVAVLFAMDATESFDGDKDMYKLKSLSTDVPSLYIVENQTEQCATALPYTKKRTVALAFESYTNGQSYTFSPEFDNFAFDGEVILEDLKTSTLTDLRTAPYQFTHDNSFDSQRFLLHFNTKENTGSVNTNMNQERTYVYGSNEGIVVHYSNQASGTDGAVTIYNALGQQVYQNNVANGQTINFQPSAPTQVYMVTIVTNGIAKTHKLLY